MLEPPSDLLWVITGRKREETHSVYERKNHSVIEIFVVGGGVKISSMILLLGCSSMRSVVVFGFSSCKFFRS